MASETLLKNFEDAVARVNWAELKHAYGVATDVPDMLRELVYPEQEVIDEAVGAIVGGTVMHQGSRFSVTLHVIPCLVALAAEEGLPDRASVLICIGWLAGYENEYVECGGEDDEDPFGEEDRQLTVECTRIALESLPFINELAAGSDERTRAMAANVLSVFRTERDTVVPFLQERAAGETSEMVRAALTVAVANLLHETPPFEAAMRAIHENEPSLLVRATAATMLAYCEMEDASVVTTLAAAVADAECLAAAEQVPFMEFYLAQEIQNASRSD
jgi:hypothetical protein